MLVRNVGRREVTCTEHRCHILSKSSLIISIAIAGGTKFYGTRWGHGRLPPIYVCCTEIGSTRILQLKNTEFYMFVFCGLIVFRVHYTNVGTRMHAPYENLSLSINLGSLE